MSAPATSVENLRERLTAGRVVVLDGALGTEIERRGIPAPAPLWSTWALLHEPVAVADIHRRYVAAGAEIVVADTFRAGPRALRQAGLYERGPELCRRAVELARQAAQQVSRPVVVAASVAPVEDCYSPELVPPEAELRAEHGELARWLAEAGAELLWIETIGTQREALAAAEAARRVGLPLVVSLVLREDGRLLGGDSLAETVRALERCEPLALGLNCIPPAGLTRHLATLRAATRRPLAAYAHINNERPTPGWSFAQRMEPGQYAEQALRWRALGAQVIGGCCGTMPEHIAALVDRLPRP